MWVIIASLSLAKLPYFIYLMAAFIFKGSSALYHLFMNSPMQQIFIAHLALYCFLSFSSQTHRLHKGIYIHYPSLFYPLKFPLLFHSIWMLWSPLPHNFFPPLEPIVDKFNTLESKLKASVGESSTGICIDISRRKKMAG